MAPDRMCLLPDRFAPADAPLRLRTAYACPTTRNRIAPNPASTAPFKQIEASWKGLTPAEQEATFKALEELQKKDWTQLSIDEKKAAYYVAFGPHGPREPILAPGSGAKTLGGVTLAVIISLGLFTAARTLAQEKPKTLSREWQEASNEMAKEQKMDPFTGVSSEGYKGKGFVNNK
ncbi:BQ2448_5884 [Microbotryum intermedium]|uniref:BQ2448_5884 protein n=1 Tax=Microbotryum intermedium TaxID=269621 RepID=A0A238F7T9_9BASI|nr:BQ2448_5884 [Microbotryum intermedium]